MPLSANAVSEALTRLPGWALVDDALERTYRCADFRAAMAFMVRIGFEAEQRNHHPELFNVYGTVRIRLTTHDAGNQVTAYDVALAEAISAVAPA